MSTGGPISGVLLSSLCSDVCGDNIPPRVNRRGNIAGAEKTYKYVYDSICDNATDILGAPINNLEVLLLVLILYHSRALQHHDFLLVPGSSPDKTL